MSQTSFQYLLPQKDKLLLALQRRSASTQEYAAWQNLIDAMSSEALQYAEEFLESEEQQLAARGKERDVSLEFYLENLHMMQQNFQRFCEECANAYPELLVSIEALQVANATVKGTSEEEVGQALSNEHAFLEFLAGCTVADIERIKQRLQHLQELTEEDKAHLEQYFSVVQQQLFEDQYAAMEEGMDRVSSLFSND